MSITRRLLHAPVLLYRWKCGWLLGHRFLLLIHTGRRTKLQRSTVLEVMEFRSARSEAIVMSAWGYKADWFRNIEVTPGPTVVIGSRRFIATHRIVDVDEAMQVLADYESRNRLFAPVIRAALSRVLGWHYDSSQAARHRAAAQVPYVAFRPLR